MLVQRQGIICRSVKYGESSLILDIFSGDVGMRSYIIGGVRTKKASSKQSTLQVMNLIEIVAYDKGLNKEGLLRIKEVRYNKIYKSIPFNIVKSSIGIFLIELSRNSIRASDDYKSLYDYMYDQLVSLDNMDEGLPHFHIRYLISFASLLGFGMNNNHSQTNRYFHLVEGEFVGALSDHRYCMDEEQSSYFNQYLNYEQVDVPREFRKSILSRLIDFYRYHIDQFGELKSLEVLNSLYSN